MNILLAELWRFWTRRMTLVAVPIFFVLAALTAVPAGMLTHPVSAEEQSRTTSQFEHDHAEWAQSCTPTDDECNYLEPDRTMYQRQPLPVAEAVTMTSSVKSGLLGLLCLVVVSSFIAAEFRSGSITTWLAFNPRRIQVYLAKLAAASVSLAVVTAVIEAATLATFWLTATIGGTSVQIANLASLICWTGVAGALLSAVVVAIAMVTRHTAAALGIAIGANFIEGIASMALWFVPSLATWGRFLPGTQLNALYLDGTTYSVPSMDSTADPINILVPATDGAVYWLVLAVVLNAIAVMNFRRREVR